MKWHRVQWGCYRSADGRWEIVRDPTANMAERGFRRLWRVYDVVAGKDDPERGCENLGSQEAWERLRDAKTAVAEELVREDERERRALVRRESVLRTGRALCPVCVKRQRVKKNREQGMPLLLTAHKIRISDNEYGGLVSHYGEWRCAGSGRSYDSGVPRDKRGRSVLSWDLLPGTRGPLAILEARAKVKVNGPAGSPK